MSERTLTLSNLPQDAERVAQETTEDEIVDQKAQRAED